VGFLDWLLRRKDAAGDASDEELQRRLRELI
jgi:hypothetical protein